MVNIDEGRIEQKLESDASRYLKKYPAQINLLESKSLLSKVRPITPMDVYTLGRMLEQFEEYRAMCEDDGTLSQLGKIPDVALTRRAA